MTVDDIHNRIFILMENRNWSVYRLAEKSGISATGLYNMIERKTMPRIDTLERLCVGFDISLSEFFAFSIIPDKTGWLSEKDHALLEINRSLPERSQDLILSYARGILDRENLTIQNEIE